MARWQSAEDRRSLSSRLGDVRRLIDDLDHAKVNYLENFIIHAFYLSASGLFEQMGNIIALQVIWTPYEGETEEGHPLVAACRHVFDRELVTP